MMLIANTVGAKHRRLYITKVTKKREKKSCPTEKGTPMARRPNQCTRDATLLFFSYAEHHGTRSFVGNLDHVFHGPFASVLITVQTVPITLLVSAGTNEQEHKRRKIW
jgi:hypothetical protein